MTDRFNEMLTLIVFQLTLLTLLRGFSGIFL
jgi:hypothetical protein